MDAITTEQLFRELQTICAASPLVKGISQRHIDIDILDVRVHLKSDSFLSVFYNLDSKKTAFALIQENRRTYGVDNAKIGWPRHPFEAPEKHVACEPITFGEFLAHMEDHFKK